MQSAAVKNGAARRARHTLVRLNPLLPDDLRGRRFELLDVDLWVSAKAVLSGLGELGGGAVNSEDLEQGKPSFDPHRQLVAYLKNVSRTLP